MYCETVHAASGDPKISLVGWDSLCQPRSCRGLGLCQLHDQNNSFLMKLDFNLVTKQDALWVLVLCTKYGMKEQLPNSIARSQCSHLWHSLSKVWSLLGENLAWSIGNDLSIRCQRDFWIPKIGPLLLFNHASTNLNLDCSLKDMVLDDGNQNLDLFWIWLPKEVIQHIIRIPSLILTPKWIELFGLLQSQAFSQFGALTGL